MKKIYFLSIGLLFGTAGMFAQTVLNDFQDGLKDSWGSWDNAATVEVVDNPASNAVNGSTKCLKLVPTGGWGSITKFYGSGYIVNKPSKISVMVYSTTASTIKLHMQSTISSGAAVVEKYLSLPAGAWTKLEYDLSAIANWDYKELIFQPEQNATFYFDNITVSYSATAVGSPKTSSTANIFASEGTINVTNAEGSKIEIYSMTGRCISSTDKASAEFMANVNSGIYMVIVDGISSKVIVQ
jgi:hypothetical protein